MVPQKHISKYIIFPNHTSIVYFLNSHVTAYRVHTKKSQLSTTFRFSDVNECMTGPNKCEQQSTTCSNKLGSYSCQCKNGYQPGNSVYKCQGKNDLIFCQRSIDVFYLIKSTWKCCFSFTPTALSNCFLEPRATNYVSQSDLKPKLAVTWSRVISRP